MLNKINKIKKKRTTIKPMMDGSDDLLIYTYLFGPDPLWMWIHNKCIIKSELTSFLICSIVSGGTGFAIFEPAMVSGAPPVVVAKMSIAATKTKSVPVPPPKPKRTAAMRNNEEAIF